MSELHNDDHRTRLRRALEALRDMRAQLESARLRHRQPIAIIGMGCRLPGGVRNPDDYWRLLSAGRDAIREVPADRWDIDAWYDPDPDAPGKVVSRYGGFLDHVDQFEPQFFGIAPREADFIDPQQRLLLEIAWESLEHAAVAADELRGSATGVFVGISSGEYGEMLTAGGPESINHYAGSGNANSVAAGRISYVLDLAGPAMAIDTACSSSLVAVNLACQSLRSGECEMALAGGVNVLLTPTVNINHSRARMLAPDGRCKTFAATADGFVRSEGCALVVLKRLDDALADHDNILAVIRGTATNQDGHTSGLTVPNGPSQEAVIVRAQQDAGVTAAEISYVEAHGTGTSLGDPIELNALHNVFAATRAADRPLYVGSVKTNLGHMEAAAGIAGLIKVVLSLRNQTIPSHLHCDEPTPRFQWGESPLLVPSRNVSWSEFAATPRLAGVSSFGFGGTNAHVIVEEGPCATPPASRSKTNQTGGARRWQLLPVSAQSDEALGQLASKYAEYLDNHPQTKLPNACLTAGAGRSHFRHRAAVMAESRNQAVERLREISERRASSGVFQDVAGVDPPKIAFLFTGQGSQYVGMGKALYETEPVFRDSMRKCHEMLRPHLDIPLLDVVYPAHGKRTPLGETAYTQPALFAIEYSLAELWRSWGIVPDVVLGHSVGEYTAACLAGVLPLEDALHLIAVRGRLMQALPRGGTMAAVFCDQQRVLAAIERHATQVSIAAINGPRNTVVSGREDQVQELLRQLRADGIEFQQLSVSHAFHSPLIEPMIAQFAAVAQGIDWVAPELDLVSNLSGQLVDSGTIDTDYWCRHMRQAVRFAESVETLYQQGCRVLVEVGPKPVLLGMAQQIVTDDKLSWLASLRPGRPDQQQLLQSLAELYARGAEVRWAGLHGEAGRRIELPTYPFQRRRHWAEAASHGPSRTVSGQTGRADGHCINPLLEERIDCASHPQEVVFQTCLGRSGPSFLHQHRVFGKPIMPASGYLAMAWGAATNVLESARLVIQDVAFHEALVLTDDEDTIVQLAINRTDGAWQVYSRRDTPLDSATWTLHASGSVAQWESNNRNETRLEDLSALRDKIDTPLSPENFYRAYSKRGVEFGHVFRAVQRLWYSNKQALGQIEISDDLDASQYHDKLHPILLDAAAQIVGAALGSRDEMTGGGELKSGATLWLQSGIEQYRIYRSPVGQLWAHASIRPTDEDDAPIADLRLIDVTGTVVAEILGQQARSANPATLLKDCASSRAEFYAVQWLLRPRADKSSSAQQGASGSTPPRVVDRTEASLLQAWSGMPSQVAVALARRINTVLASPDIVAYANLLAELESLSPWYITRALDRMGWSQQPHVRFDASELCQRLGVRPQFERLFSRLLEILADVGILHRRGMQWEVISDISNDELERRVADLQERHASSAELELLDRCGRQLADVLCGQCEPLELIFPDGDMTTAARVYGDAPGVKAISTLLASGIEQALQRLPSDRPLKILEVGAGTGGTTSYVLPNLPADRTQYVFTDISRHFLPAAGKKFARFPFVRYQLLDIERSPSEQGLDGTSFDLIIASNVLHATRNLRDTVRHIGQLLAPGGLLWLVENVVPSAWVELIWGLTDGWWRFDDDLRTSHPLLTGDGWRQLLQANGFSDVESIVADVDQHGHLARQAIILAQHGLPVQIEPRLGASGDQAMDEGLSMHAPAWVILAEPGRLGETLAASLSLQGNRCLRVHSAKQFAQHSRDLFDVGPNRRADFERLIEHIVREGHRISGVVHMWGCAAAPIESLAPAEVGMRVQESCMGFVHLVQALAEHPFATPPALWLVTRAAQPVLSGPGGLRPDQSPLWSIGKVVALEHPNLWGGMLDLDPDSQADEIPAIVNELLHSDGEDQVALRGRDRFVPRLARSVPRRVSTLSIRSDASYLITGGCGALGLAAASWLVERGARHLILLGRSGLATVSARQAVTSLERAGAKVRVVSADVSNDEEMSSLFRRFDTAWPRLSGIVHAAGRPGYRLLAELDDETLQDVMAAKVTGTWVLHELTKDMALDFFLCCSSMVSVWGAKGQSHYGAANHFLDVVAHYRRGLGLPGLSVDWGPMTDGGMLPAEDVAELKRIGVSTTPMHQAVTAFAQLLGSDLAQSTLVDIDWPIFKAVFESRRKQPLFELLGVSQLVSGPSADISGGLDQSPRDADSIVEILRAAAPGERRELLSDHVQHVLASVLGLVERPDEQTGFFDMGMDSLTAMELRSRLEKTLDTSLPATLAFDFTTVETLTNYLWREVTLCAELEDLQPQAPQPSTQWDERAALKVEHLSDEEVERLLRQKLEYLGYN